MRTERFISRGLHIAAVALTCSSWLKLGLAAESDLDAGWRLVKEGQLDRAEELASKMARGSGSAPETRAAADLIRAEVLLSRSEGETQVDRALKLLDDSVDLLKGFLRTNPPTALAGKAKRGIDWRLHRKASRAAQALRELKPTEAAKARGDLVEAATSLYEAASLRYRDRIRELRASKVGADESVLAEVLLDHAKALLEHGRLEGLAEEARKPALSEAASVLEDLEYDYGDEALSFEALWVEGLCQVELGNTALAEDRFLGATTLTSRLRQSGKEPNDYQLSIVRGAYLALSESYLKAGKAGETAALVDRVLRKEPALEREPAGWALKLQKAEALFQQGNIEEAHSLASQVMSADFAGKLGAAAKEKMKSWASDAQTMGSLVTPERLLIKATALMENEAWSQALQALRAILEISAAGDDRGKYAADASFKMGQCFSRMRRYQEAACAFERVFEAFPGRELAPRACFEAVRALGSEFALTGEAEDDEAKEKLLQMLLKKWPDHPVAQNVIFLHAEKLERQQKYKEAAELFLKVPKEAEAFESALLGAARCRFLQAGALWDAREKEPSAAEAAKGELARAEKVLALFFERVRNPSFLPKDAEALRQRSSVTFLATQQLTLIKCHEALGKHAEALECLESYARTLSKDDPRHGRVLALEVRPYLALKKGEEAVRVVEELLEKFPESPALLSVSKSVADYLAQASAATSGETKDASPVASPETSPGQENRKKMHKYYVRWVKDSVVRGIRIPTAEVLAIANLLYRSAKVLNGLEDKASFLLAPGAAFKEPHYFADTAAVCRLLADGKLGALDPSERLEASLTASRCDGFLARDAHGWAEARNSYQAIIKSFRLLSSDNKIDAAALSLHGGALVAAYLELGVVYQELAKNGQGALFDAAIAVFQNVQGVTEGGSEPWWLAKFLTARALLERETAADLRLARIILENAEKNYPDYDAGKFGMKPRLLELKQRLGGSRAGAQNP
jgi:tetratricopeptide (TPR) repeat protein